MQQKKDIRIKIAAVIFLVLAAACMGIMFFFSSQGIHDSTVVSRFFCTIPTKFLAGWDSLNHWVGVTGSYADVYDFWLVRVDGVVRKIAHFTEYAILGGVLYIALSLFLPEKYNTRKIVIRTAFIICVLFAAGDEIHQIFVPGRGPGVKDVVIDSCGAAFAIFVLDTIKKWYLRHKQKNGSV